MRRSHSRQLFFGLLHKLNNYNLGATLSIRAVVKMPRKGTTYFVGSPSCFAVWSKQ